MKILVADDEVISLIIAKAAVEGLGHECITATEGLAAWDLLLEHSPQVLITDREMPGVDGVELCRRIRAAERHSRTYIVVLTAHGDAADVLSGMRAGADDYITKPLSPIGIEVALLRAARVTALHAELAALRAEPGPSGQPDLLQGPRNPGA